MSSSLAFPPPATADAVEALKAIARHRWFKNEEIVAVLSNVLNYGLIESQTPPDQPSSGSIFVFNKRTIRTWRRDGHEWKKKKDGKNVMEHHEKLKVQKIERITCCYAHHEHRAGFHRRCYWLLESPDMVFVHYLQQPSGDTKRHSSKVPMSLAGPALPPVYAVAVPNLNRALDHIQFYAKSKAPNTRLSRISPYFSNVPCDFSLRRERRAEVARQMRQRKKAHLQQLESRIEYLSKQIEALDVRSAHPGRPTIRHDNSPLVLKKLAHDLQVPSLSQEELEQDLDMFFHSISERFTDAQENLVRASNTALEPGLQSKFALWSVEQIESKYLHCGPEHSLWYSVLQEIDASPQQVELLSRHRQTARNLRLEHQHIARALHVCASNMAKYASEWHKVLERIRSMLGPLQMAQLLVLLEHSPTPSPSPTPAPEQAELSLDMRLHL